MPKKGPQIINPAFNEFVFDVIANSTTEQRSALTAHQVKIISRGAKQTVSWIARASMEDKLILLMRLGVPFHMAFGDVGNNKVLSDLYKKYKKQPNAALEEAMQIRLHVVSDKHLMRLLNVLSSSFASDNYLLNRDYLKLAYKLRTWKQQPVPGNPAVRETLSMSREMAKLFLSCIENVRFTEGLTSLNESQVAVLLYLFKSNNPYVLDSELRAKFDPIYVRGSVSAALRKLVEMMYVEKHRVDGKTEYCTTALGNNVVMKFQKRVMDNVLG